MFISLGIVMVFSPAFLAVGMAFGGLGVWLGRQYMRAQLPVRREWSKAKAPVLATVDDIITGLGNYVYTISADFVHAVASSIYPCLCR